MCVININAITMIVITINVQIVINENAITMIVININAQIVINHSPPVESEHLGRGHAPQKYFQTRNTTPHDW